MDDPQNVDLRRIFDMYSILGNMRDEGQKISEAADKMEVDGEEGTETDKERKRRAKGKGKAKATGSDEDSGEEEAEGDPERIKCEHEDPQLPRTGNEEDEDEEPNEEDVLTLKKTKDDDSDSDSDSGRQRDLKRERRRSLLEKKWAEEEAAAILYEGSVSEDEPMDLEQDNDFFTKTTSSAYKTCLNQMLAAQDLRMYGKSKRCAPLPAPPIPEHRGRASSADPRANSDVAEDSDTSGSDFAKTAELAKKRRAQKLRRDVSVTQEEDDEDDNELAKEAVASSPARPRRHTGGASAHHQVKATHPKMPHSQQGEQHPHKPIIRQGERHPAGQREHQGGQYPQGEQHPQGEQQPPGQRDHQRGRRPQGEQHPPGQRHPQGEQQPHPQGEQQQPQSKDHQQTEADRRAKIRSEVDTKSQCVKGKLSEGGETSKGKKSSWSRQKDEIQQLMDGVQEDGDAVPQDQDGGEEISRKRVSRDDIEACRALANSYIDGVQEIAQERNLSPTTVHKLVKIFVRRTPACNLWNNFQLVLARQERLPGEDSKSDYFFLGACLLTLCKVVGSTSERRSTIGRE